MNKIYALILVLTLSACGGTLGTLGKAALGVGGGGPNVNAQVGKEVTQQVVGSQERIEVGRDQFVTTTKLQADQVRDVTVNETPIWMIVLLVLGWLLPSPAEISRVVRGWFGK
jgi:hypothetical protein